MIKRVLKDIQVVEILVLIILSLKLIETYWNQNNYAVHLCESWYQSKSRSPVLGSAPIQT